jgi:ribosome maturation factor RimP
MMELIGKTVEVGTVETVYIGKLIEVNDEEVYLESESGWIVIPVDRVAYVREKED